MGYGAGLPTLNFEDGVPIGLTLTVEGLTAFGYAGTLVLNGGFITFDTTFSDEASGATIVAGVLDLTPVPLPPAMALLASALAVLGLARWRTLTSV